MRGRGGAEGSWSSWRSGTYDVAEVMEEGKAWEGREVETVQRPPGGGLGAAGSPRELVV